MNQEKVQLYKIRDFGAKINVTIEYIRHNLVPLLKVVLLIVVPVALLFAILFSDLFSTIVQFSVQQDSANPDPLGMMSALGSSYFLMMLLSTISIAFLLTLVFGYMKMNNQQEEKPAPMEVLKNMLPKIPMVVLLIILCSLVSFIGFFFFIIPGIYLMITFSLAVPIYVFEDKGVGEAFSKSFKLIKGKWWSTFGLILITGIIATVISYIFFIPMYALMIGGMVSSMGEAGGNPEDAFAVLTSWYTVAGLAIVMIGSYITYLVPIIAVAFQYFNLSERVEGKGIRNQIQEFETV